MSPVPADRRPEAMAAAGERDGSIDRLRVAAVIGVVSGHWLTTAFVVGDYGIGVSSPLRHFPDLAPVTWVLQMLAPFFCAAGFAAARSLTAGRPLRSWLNSRLRALLPPVGIVIACWAVLLGVLLPSGFSVVELRSLGKLVISPLWFLAVLAVLWAAWTPLEWLDRRLGGFSLLPPALVVCAADLVRFGGVSIGPEAELVLGLCATVCAWAIPFLFGIRLARAGGPGIGGGMAMALSGMVGMAVLVLGAGYSPMAVGVTGADQSNLNPPSLFVVALGVAQLGLFVLMRRAASRARSAPSPRLTRLNRIALPVFLWHQSALILLVLVAAEWVPVAGLVGSPANPDWVLLRLACFPALVLVLALLVRFSGARPGARRVR